MVRDFAIQTKPAGHDVKDTEDMKDVFLSMAGLADGHDESVGPYRQVLPDAIFNNLPRDDQRKWATMSSESKKLIVNVKNTASRGRLSRQCPTRQQRVLFHETDDVSDDDGFEDAEQFEEYDDDSPGSIIAKMHDIGTILVNAARGKGASSKKPKKPLKSALTPAHPSCLLADDK